MTLTSWSFGARRHLQRAGPGGSHPPGAGEVLPGAGNRLLFYRSAEEHDHRGEETPIGLTMCGEREPGADRAGAAGPKRYPSDGVFGGAAAEGDAGSQVARGQTLAGGQVERGIREQLS